MKKIVTFKCRKYDSLSVPLYHIYVYDINNNLITDKYTNNIGNIKIAFSYYGIYKLHILDSRNCRKNCIVILVNEKFPDELFIINDIKTNNFHPINLILTDKYYKNLPITKGDVVLWQKNI